ncbi:MAG: FAD-dependent oxidoreductase, partial [Leptonema sp. (in: Bacteria)]|nr:FAD-dependent oxidoreductase [Leptonema sp. (in: bacteria)]
MSYITEINATQYADLVVNTKGPVILDFYSDDCVPCESLASKYESLALLFGSKVKFLKIFRQQNRDLALSLGVKSSPTLIFYIDGKEVGNRLTGAIRKSAIVNQISSMLTQDEFNQLYSNRQSKRIDVDVAILGGGPAGLTAALYAAQAKLKVLVIDQDLTGGQVKITHLISNYPGTGGPVSGWELSEKMLRQAEEAGAEVLSAVDVTSVKLKEGNHIIQIDNEINVHSAVVILATGAEPRLLSIVGEKEYKGKGISYCATCDGKYYQDKEVIVIGGGNSAIEESLFLTKFASKVTIIHQFDHLQANKTAQEQAFANDKIQFIWNTEARSFELQENGQMKVTVENLTTNQKHDILTDGAFV